MTLAGAGGLRATADSWFLQGPRTENGFFSFFKKGCKNNNRREEEHATEPVCSCEPKILTTWPFAEKVD